jgi:hypothetical protein
MNKVFLMQTPYVAIRFDEFNKLLIAKWTGFLTLEQVVSGCSFMTQLFRDHGISIHMSLHRDLRVLSPEVQEYLIEKWFPEIEKLGVRKVGAVVADDAFAEATVSRVNQEGTNGGLVIEMFEDETDCVRWLIEK